MAGRREEERIATNTWANRTGRKEVGRGKEGGMKKEGEVQRERKKEMERRTEIER